MIRYRLTLMLFITMCCYSRSFAGSVQWTATVRPDQISNGDFHTIALPANEDRKFELPPFVCIATKETLLKLKSEPAYEKLITCRYDQEVFGVDLTCSKSISPQQNFLLLGHVDGDDKKNQTIALWHLTVSCKMN